MQILKGFIIIAATATLGACATTSNRFEWGNYESALYAYAKSPDQLQAYRKSLQQAVERGRKEDRVAPGLLAELGYLHLQEGDTAVAVALFDEEMQRFPESRRFLSGVMARVSGATVMQPSNQQDSKS